MVEKSDIFSIALFFAALVHAIIILGVSFRMPDIASRNNNDNNLDIVLINSSNNLRDEDAETISVEDNTGGGKEELEAQTPLPFEAVNPMPIESIKKTASSQTQTTIAPDDLLVSNSSDITIAREQPEEAQIKTPEKATGPDLITTKSVRQLERERLIAKLKKDWVDYQKRPRKEFLSPTTKATEAARYLSKWIEKVQRVGNANMPRQIREQQLVGIVIVSVEIAENGTLSKIVLDHPSRHRVLNDYTKRLLREASPFDPFPDEQYFDNINVLVITRSFEFDSQQGFSNNAMQ
ncbi:MAG: energy transducer TonB [Arenicella sp.]|jgi:protein TonB|nr:energy transducer TonB [Arenicella sp.]